MNRCPSKLAIKNSTRGPADYETVPGQLPSVALRPIPYHSVSSIPPSHVEIRAQSLCGRGGLSKIE